MAKMALNDTNPQSNRIYFMDSMRSILMILGIALHSANAFNTEQDWLIHTDNTSIFADYIALFIHSFRMPAFFVVSGFFCALILQKQGAAEFVRIRSIRILIPLLVTAFTLNSMQTLILASTGFTTFSIQQHIFNGGWSSHLWFLINLVVYFTLAVLMTILAKPLLIRLEQLATRLFLAVPVILSFLLLSILTLMILSLNKIGFPLYEKYLSISIYGICLYSPFFVFGALLTNKKTLIKLINAPPLSSILAISLSMLALQHLSGLDETAQNVITEYLINFISWVMISLCFLIFSTYFNKPSKIWKKLSEASYTVYLFHHIFIISFGIIVFNLNLNFLLSILILSISTLLTTLFIHKHYISKSPILYFLFNGKSVLPTHPPYKIHSRQLSAKQAFRQQKN